MNRINKIMALWLTLGLLTGGAALPAFADSASSDQSVTTQTTETTQTTPTSRRTRTTTTQTTETQRSQTNEMPRKHPILMYIPNRIFDALDIVRARVRIGPGLSVGARVGSIATVFVGGHSTAYVGLPGPRGKPEISLPFGLEDSAGQALAPAKESEAEIEKHPYYGPTEIGVEAQVAIVGVSVGVEPLEALDFLAGIFFIDLKGDDF